MRGPHVLNNDRARRFEFEMDGQVGFLRYRLSGNQIRLIHTEIPESLRSRGYATELRRAAFEHAEKEHLRVVPGSPFVQAYLARHPELIPLVEPAE